MNTEPINLRYTTLQTPLPDFIHAGIATFTRDSNMYRIQPPELVTPIAKLYNIPSSMVFLTAGIDEAIQLFILAYGTHTHIFTPTYSTYTDADVFGKKLTRIPSLQDEYSIKPFAYPEATLIFLANPNNPCGITSREDIITLAQHNPQAIVCIDEAYGEFADVSVIQHIQHQKNLVVFRSFSKAYGMAGARIGYVLSSQDILAKIKPYATWANISYLSVGAAITALGHTDYFKGVIADVVSRKKALSDYMANKGYPVLATDINAVLLRFPTVEQATAFVSHLTSHNIVVNHGNGNSNVGLTQMFVRISIGTPEQMKVFRHAVDTHQV